MTEPMSAESLAAIRERAEWYAWQPGELRDAVVNLGRDVLELLAEVERLQGLAQNPGHLHAAWCPPSCWDAPTGSNDDGWQLGHDYRKEQAAETRTVTRQVQYEDGEWSREVEVWEEPA